MLFDVLFYFCKYFRCLILFQRFQIIQIFRALFFIADFRNAALHFRKLNRHLANSAVANMGNVSEPFVTSSLAQTFC